MPFTKHYTDQTLEQEIKALKRHGGIVGLSQDESALDRLVTITPHLAHIVKQYLNSFPKATESSNNEHYQLTGDTALRMTNNALRIKESIMKHCEGNVFTEKTPLKDIASSALVSDKDKDDILHFSEKGQKRFEQFVYDRLMTTSRVSILVGPYEEIQAKNIFQHDVKDQSKSRR